jgi:hypothetical protein
MAAAGPVAGAGAASEAVLFAAAVVATAATITSIATTSTTTGTSIGSGSMSCGGGGCFWSVTSVSSFAGGGSGSGGAGLGRGRGGEVAELVVEPGQGPPVQVLLLPAAGRLGFGDSSAGDIARCGLADRPAGGGWAFDRRGRLGLGRARQPVYRRRRSLSVSEDELRSQHRFGGSTAAAGTGHNRNLR